MEGRSMGESTNPITLFLGILRRYPSRKAAFFFSILARLGHSVMKIALARRLLVPIGNFLGLLSTIVAPTIPDDIRRASSYKSRWTIVTYAFPITIFFCFGMNLVLTWYYGTLIGDDPSRQYFWNDWPDILQFTVIVPSSVSANCCLIATVLNNWRYLNIR